MKVISRKEALALGLKRYFTGKPCKRGHLAERRVSAGHCVECFALTSAVWDQVNRERKNLHTRNYYATERGKEKRAAWSKANPSYYKKYISPDRSHRWYMAHRENCIANAKKNKKRRAAMTEMEKQKARENDRKAYYRGPQNPTGETQWLRKNVAQLRALRRLLRKPHEVSQLLSEASKLGLNLDN